MTILSLLLLLQAVNVASFSPAPRQCYQHQYEYKGQDHNTRRVVSNAPGLKYSLTVEDWHTASQLHPLDNLGVIDEESSSAIMMMGLTDAYEDDISGTVAADGNRVASRQPKKISAVNGGGDIMREFTEAFFPVVLLILLEIYSQKILQFPLA